MRALGNLQIFVSLVSFQLPAFHELKLSADLGRMILPGANREAESVQHKGTKKTNRRETPAVCAAMNQTMG